MAIPPIAASRPNATIRPLLDTAGAGTVISVQTSSMQKSPASHCEVSSHDPPTGTGGLIGVAVGVLVGVDVGV